jgi:prepilin-type N-terminal cleavage/methylation domain-containing protein
MRRAFTLIELLVVIAIIAILAVVVVLTLNPAEMLRQARDSNRLSDMATLNTAINLYNTDQGGASGYSLGSSNVVYVSIPDPNATTTSGTNCSLLSLPALPATYSYHCAASSTFRNSTNLGWIPINFSTISSGAPISNLPIDPINTSSSRLYYTYATNGTNFEVTTAFESQKYKLGGANDQISGDGGTLASTYEKGSKLGLEPLDYGDNSLVGYWTFDEGTGTVAYDYSGNNATGSWNGTAAYAAGKIGAYAGNFNGTTSTYVDVVGNPISLRLAGNAMTQIAWIYPLANIANSTIATKPNSYYFQRDASGKLASYQQGTTPAGYLYSTDTAQLSMWSFVAYTYDGSNIIFYINGAQSGITAKTGSISSSGYDLIIGGDSSVNTRYWNGLIDDVRIYNRALSATEIQAIYNGGK